ncbi:TITAN-like protein [Silene latifolia]|uniref:TITAN-like protein n=1 Tax=Silene latifolia TaxID=37657 RepID=UPI003D775691
MKLEKKKKNEEYEYCKVCRINHNQGRRHNFFPRHTNSLSSLFSRFLNKLSLLNSSISNPTFNLPHHASSISPEPFWCIFCEFDVDNAGSSFTSGNVIKHLASEDHLKNVKQFLCKYGAGSNKLDSFRVTETKFAEWEKCEVLRCKAAATSGICQGSLSHESNDIQQNYGILNNFDNNNIHFLASNLSNNVLPLQYDTNENYQVCHSDISEADKTGRPYPDLGLPIPQGSEHGLNTWSSTYTDYGSVRPLPSTGANLLAKGPAHGEVQINRPTTTREPYLNGYQTLSRITSGKSDDDKGNVYSGAPPPWLEEAETVEVGQSTTTRSIIAQTNCRKASKLNPKRVGAAWAEKRKRELEMEKRGEIVANTSAPDWLPNFGSVWQSGSQKESLKEFKKEKVDVSKADSQPEAKIKLQPYISKRMRLGTDTFSSGGVQEAGDTS